MSKRILQKDGHILVLTGEKSYVKPGKYPVLIATYRCVKCQEEVELNPLSEDYTGTCRFAPKTV